MDRSTPTRKSPVLLRVLTVDKKTASLQSSRDYPSRSLRQFRDKASLLLVVIWLSFFLFGRASTSASAGQTEPSTPLHAAQSALEHGDPNEAIRLLSSYLENHPADLQARLALGQSYAVGGQFDKATKQFLEALKIGPKNPVALRSLGEIYAHEGQFEKAEPLLARAVQVSNDPEIRIEWAVALVRLRQYKKAQMALAGVSPPNDAGARVGFYRLKASMSSGLGDSLLAASDMEKALALNPNDSGLILATATAQFQAKNFKRAADLAGPIFSATQDTSAGFLLLEAQLGAKQDFQPVLAVLRSNSSNRSNELAIRLHLAELLASYGKTSESLEDFQRAAEIEPTRGDLLFNLALAQFRLGQWDAALATAEKSKSLADTSDLEDLLGDIDEARGDNLSAAKSYQAAIALSPNDEKYRLSLAVELIRHKSFEAAKLVLQQAQQLPSNSWRIDLALGMVEYFLGNDEESTRILLHSADRSPQPSLALKYVGDIQLDQVPNPDGAVVTRICKTADNSPKDSTMQYYCGALLFKRDYAAGSKTGMQDSLRRLNAAAKHLPDDASPHCQLGKAYFWMEHWNESLNESELCARLKPDSAEAHYRLMQLYRRMDRTEEAKQQLSLYEAASKQMADENAHRDETIKTFLYTIEMQTPTQTNPTTAPKGSSER